MHITNDIRYIGVNDRKIDLFEGQYVVPNGMAYNSYVILDEKIAVMDTVDQRFGAQWLENLSKALEGRAPDYLIVQHMEPDHSGSVADFARRYPQARIVSSDKAFVMMKHFFGEDFAQRRVVVGEGDTLPLGRHTLHFVAAPMVHWPEVIVTYDAADKVLFSADGFGKFGALDAQEDWACEARRYYFGIVGKYGAQVQRLLKKAAALDISVICPLHGPVLKENLGYYLDLYDLWSSYGVESEGILIAYTSVYGNTKRAVDLLAQRLREKGCPKVILTDLARADLSEAVEDAFRYGKVVLATTTYNADIFPPMRALIEHLTERGWRGRTVGLIENGSWAPRAAHVMRELLAGSRLTFTETTVTLRSALDESSRAQLDALADELCRDYAPAAQRTDPAALFQIGYGLYVLTTRDGARDNGMIVNTVTQVNDRMVAVTVNKRNFSFDTIRKTGVLNVNCLTVQTPFRVFEQFGFRSGRDVDKFAGAQVRRSENGLAILPEYSNAFLSLQVEQYVDLDTHGMFLCSITESRVLSNEETMTYTYYHKNVKPRPATEGKKGFVCKVCGYVYEGETLPEDFICPLCKHGAADFEPIA